MFPGLKFPKKNVLLAAAGWSGSANIKGTMLMTVALALRLAKLPSKHQSGGIHIISNRKYFLHLKRIASRWQPSQSVIVLFAGLPIIRVTNQTDTPSNSLHSFDMMEKPHSDSQLQK